MGKEEDREGEEREEERKVGSEDEGEGGSITTMTPIWPCDWRRGGMQG